MVAFFLGGADAPGQGVCPCFNPSERKRERERERGGKGTALSPCPRAKPRERERETTGGTPAPSTTTNTEKGGKPSGSGGSNSSEEEPESSVSTTRTLLRGSHGGVNCAAGSCGCYRGQWANLVFDKTGKRLHVEEDVLEKGNFVRLTAAIAAQTEKVVTQLMECAYYSLMIRIYGGDAQFRALQTCLREQQLQATDVWTACRVRFHERVTMIRALLDGRLVPRPEIATAQEDIDLRGPPDARDHEYHLGVYGETSYILHGLGQHSGKALKQQTTRKQPQLRGLRPKWKKRQTGPR